MHTRYLVYDTETASLQGGVCEIAVALIDDEFEVTWESDSLTNPECPISPGASGIHHITDDMVKDEPTLAGFMELTGFPFDSDDLVTIGHNVQFDNRMIAAHLPEKYRSICTLKLARMAWPDMSDHKLQTLRYAHKLTGNAHRALGDVQTCIGLLRLLGEHWQCGLAGLLERSSAPLSSDSKLGVGKKHRDTKIKDVPVSYLRWMMDTMTDLSPDLRAAITARL